MALRLSTGLRNYMLNGGSLADALYNGKIIIYSGSQPASANTTPPGSPLVTISNNSVTPTAEVLATGTVTLSGASGTLDTLTVGGVSVIDNVITFTTDLSTTAALVAAEINRNSSQPEYTATSSGAVVTIIAPRGSGAHTATVTSVSTTLGSADVDVGTASAGTAAANGLLFGTASAGTLSKLASQTWSGSAGTSGTAGWFRFFGAVADGGGTDTSEVEIRLDGAIATSGGELNMSSTSIASAATQTISSFAITLPTS